MVFCRMFCGQVWSSPVSRSLAEFSVQSSRVRFTFAPSPEQLCTTVHYGAGNENSPPKFHFPICTLQSSVLKPGQAWLCRVGCGDLRGWEVKLPAKISTLFFVMRSGFKKACMLFLTVIHFAFDWSGVPYSLVACSLHRCAVVVFSTEGAYQKWYAL